MRSESCRDREDRDNFSTSAFVTQNSTQIPTVEIQSANGSEERRRIPTIVHTFAHQWLTLIIGEQLDDSTSTVCSSIKV